MPRRPDRAGQRAGHRRPLRALRRRGHQARADPVVLQITDYAQELLDNLDALEPTWPDRVIKPSATGSGAPRARTSPSRSRRRAAVGLHDPAGHAVRRDVHGGGGRREAGPRAGHRRPAADLDAYLAEVRKATDIDRLSTDREKTGVFLGRYAVNPVNGQQIPIWAADYVLTDYGTGAIMAVPGQDQRDWEFAEKFDLPSSGRCTVGGLEEAAGRPTSARGRRSTPPTTRSPWTVCRSPRPRRRSSTGWRRRASAPGQ